MPTRGRCRRSASQQTPTVGSLDNWPSEWSSIVWQSEPLVAERQVARLRELARVQRRALPMARVVRLVLTPGVVEQPEAKDERPVAPGYTLGELEPRRGHAAPVLLPVHPRPSHPRALERYLDKP